MFTTTARPLIAAALALALTGCGADDPPDPDAAFVAAMAENAPAMSTAGVDSLVATAKSMCAFLDAGGTVDDVLNTTAEEGLPILEAGFFVGAGVRAYCPRNTHLLPTR